MVRKKYFIYCILFALSNSAYAVDATSGASARRASSGETYYVLSNKEDLSLPVQARDLYFRLKENEQAEVEAYGRTPMTVTGTVTYVGPDIHHSSSIKLSDQPDGKTYVLCVFSSEAEIAGFSIGDSITVSGEFHIMSSTDSVVLKQSKQIN